MPIFFQRIDYSTHRGMALRDLRAAKRAFILTGFIVDLCRKENYLFYGGVKLMLMLIKMRMMRLLMARRRVVEGKKKYGGEPFFVAQLPLEPLTGK